MENKELENKRKNTAPKTVEKKPKTNRPIKKETEEGKSPVPRKKPVSKEKTSVKKEIFSWIKTIVFALILAFLITRFIIVNAVVPSGSMENTVMTDDRLIANRLSYIFSDPERYDIVVFKYPDDEDTLFIKRIIGMPGETITIRDGQVYVEGQEEPLRSDFVNGEMDTSEFNPNVQYPMTIKIPQKGDKLSDYDHIADPEIYDKDGDGKFDEDCYIMLGDNRNNSADSRLWQNRYLSKNKIEGKAVLRYFPFTSIGTIE